MSRAHRFTHDHSILNSNHLRQYRVFSFSRDLRKDWGGQRSRARFATRRMPLQPASLPACQPGAHRACLLIINPRSHRQCSTRKTSLFCDRFLFVQLNLRPIESISFFKFYLDFNYFRRRRSVQILIRFQLFMTNAILNSSIANVDDFFIVFLERSQFLVN